MEFSGDEPTRAHSILWNKSEHLASIGGKYPEPSEKVPLVVVGGGMSGICSAYLLREFQPILLEQASRFGGNSKGESWEGIDYSIGAAYFNEPDSGSALDAFITEIGVKEVMRMKRTEDPVSLDGRLQNAFWDGGTARTQKERKKIRQIASLFKNVLHDEDGFTYPDFPPTTSELRANLDRLDRVSLKSFLEKNIGSRLPSHAETAIEQYCWSSFAASYSEVSAAAGLNFYAADFGNTVVLPGGNAKAAELTLEKLAKAVPQTNLRVKSIVIDVRVTADGAVVTYIDAEKKIRSIHAKSVVMSCPKFIAAKILQDPEPARVAAIQKLRYRSYVVANVLIKGTPPRDFYDLYMLGDGKVDLGSIRAASNKRIATDVILANYAGHSHSKNTVLTLYQAFPYDGARPALLSEGAYEKVKRDFEKNIHETILPLLGITKDRLAGLRLTRWGHPIPVSATGLVASGVTDEIQKPYRERVFFVEQDNWMLPCFESAVGEAMTWAPKVKSFLRG